MTIRDIFRINKIPAAARSVALGLLVVLLPQLIACAATEETEKMATTTKPQEGLAFTGSVVRVEIEGGFWAIVTDNGTKFDPAKLPQELQQDGLAVTGRVRLLKDVMTFRMWGQPVEILEIQRK